MTTLRQWKENLTFEANDIERKLDKGQNTSDNIQRLEQIEELFTILKKVEKPDSMLKKKLEKTEENRT